MSSWSRDRFSGSSRSWGFSFRLFPTSPIPWAGRRRTWSGTWITFKRAPPSMRGRRTLSGAPSRCPRPFWKVSFARPASNDPVGKRRVAYKSMGKLSRFDELGRGADRQFAPRKPFEVFLVPGDQKRGLLFEGGLKNEGVVNGASLKIRLGHPLKGLPIVAKIQR